MAEGRGSGEAVTLVGTLPDGQFTSRTLCGSVRRWWNRLTFLAKSPIGPCQSKATIGEQHGNKPLLPTIRPPPGQ
jgi:hypothetical protein